MSEPKIVEAVGKGRVDLSKLIKPTDGRVSASITTVRVQKIRDGVVYEDVTMECKPSGFHG